MTEELLKQGIAAAKADDREEAFRLLMQVTQSDPDNERAWLWLSQVVDSLEDRVICLENVLAINPDNRSARAGLAWLADRGVATALPESASQPPPVAAPEPAFPPSPLPLDVGEPGPASPPVSVPVDEGEPEPASRPAWASGPEFAPLPEPSPASEAESCPRCGSPVPLAQNDCAHCGLPMIIVCPRCGNHVEVAEPSCPNCELVIGDFRAGAGYHLALAEAYLEQGKSDLVPSALAHARNDAPSDPEVLVRVAEMHVELGNAASAAEVLDKAATVAKHDPGLQMRLGHLYECVGRPDRAREAYELSAQLGDHPAGLVELARLELGEGHAAQARELLLEATKENPLNADAYLLLGDAERQMGRGTESMRRYQQASRLTSRETAVGREIFSRLVEMEGYTVAEGRVEEGTGDGDEGHRPGCVTVYALLLALPALVGLCILAFALVTGSGAPDDLGLAPPVLTGFTTLREILPLTIALIVVTGVLQLLLAAGLWSMKNWARLILIAFQLIVFIGHAIATGYALLNLRAGAFQIPPSPGTIGILISFVVLGLEAYIVVWFATNRWRFS